jgi:hypothetical protein
MFICLWVPGSEVISLQNVADILAPAEGYAGAGAVREIARVKGGEREIVSCFLISSAAFARESSALMSMTYAVPFG